MAYVTPEQFLDRYDPRDVGDIVSKDNIRVSESDLLNHSKLNRALEDASGTVRSAVLVGRKYTEAELNTLAKAQDPFLVEIVCDLAMERLLVSRSLQAELTPQILQAREWVALLRLGERILNVDANAAAGLTTSKYISQQRRQFELRFAADMAAPRFFINREVRFVS